MTTHTHLRVTQNVDCRGRHLARGEVVAVAELTLDQVDDLVIDKFAEPFTPPAAAGMVVEAAAAAPEVEAAALSVTRTRRGRG